MTDPQPEYVWAYSDEKPRRGRVWLIVGLAVVAVLIATVAFWLFLRPGAPSADPTTTTSATPTAIPSASSTPPMTPEPAPVETPPTPPEPDLSGFREQVRPWLDDALTGLSFLTDSGPEEAASIVDSLRGDAQRLADAQVPASIGTDWQDHLTAYSQHLEVLRTAVSSGADSADAMVSARASVEALRAVAGL
ncbi:hypothetical protein FM104_07065 [Microbacterium esteraromaticum]|uniref:Uncharacterized protein n=1 Tax=Microbacterium esteraromaticum TaxID=57043 RepID=A0A1R4JF49_9MICO|nr:hypothetical protein [Microbacterium esteraromaticum]SJN30632.1 hypothetical protein FM104_07065 [Microbacterium esteraromaticum]